MDYAKQVRRKWNVQVYGDVHIALEEHCIQMIEGAKADGKTIDPSFNDILRIYLCIVDMVMRASESDSIYEVAKRGFKLDDGRD